MIRYLDGERPVFALETDNTSYIFSVAASGHLEHLWYGARVPLESAADVDVFREKRAFELGNVIAYSKEHPTVLLEDMCLEVSSPGHGDVREPSVELVKPDGSRSADFRYSGYEILAEKPALQTLPSSRAAAGESESLRVDLTDGDLTLSLLYTVFPACDVLTRSAVLTNNGSGAVTVLRLLSAQLDLPLCGVSVSSFHGAWAREMNRSAVTLNAGKFVVESRAGCSSSRANPFFMVHAPNADERMGDCYGFNLVYSGNHYAAVEVSAFGKTRIANGVNPAGFSCLLEGGERFEAPEAVLTYSCQGFGGQSRNMHRFVQRHIVRGEWADKPRPVLLNSWEACYFNISEHSLVSLAKAGRELGVELFVMDDGWFGERSDDSRSLGDWDANPKKLPGGLKRLGEKITALGLRFGVWVEPEMVNVQSKLYEAHPDWAMAAPNALHSEGRNQRILDLSNPAVQDFIIEKMTEVFSSADITYVKWDMNRIFSDAYSPYLPAARQGECAHRYILGLYRVMDELTRRFPQILFEGCASGGNRFDLGILCYFPQIWGSDNTDALCRATIQEGYSFGYPPSCVAAHVAASPNHQTLRRTPLETRYAVASFGALGYELDVRDLSAGDKQKIQAQIAQYKAWREVLQFGDFFRVLTGNLHEWMTVSPDKSRGVGLLLQELGTPNTQAARFYPQGLDADKAYRVYSLPGRLDIKQFGSLINTMTPVHIKQDSALHNVIAKAVKMNGETEELRAPGDLLMKTGVALKPAFSGTGFNENVRVFPDFAARIYYFEADE